MFSIGESPNCWLPSVNGFSSISNIIDSSMLMDGIDEKFSCDCFDHDRSLQGWILGVTFSHSIFRRFINFWHSTAMSKAHRNVSVIVLIYAEIYLSKLKSGLRTKRVELTKLRINKALSIQTWVNNQTWTIKDSTLCRPRSRPSQSRKTWISPPWALARTERKCLSALSTESREAQHMYRGETGAESFERVIIGGRRI
jgi:hypothetical protein